MRILVTGGAGYIGSHAARWLDRSGHEVWVFDNLSTGHRAAALPSRSIEGELTDREHLENVLRDKNIDAVMHFAASALVGESVEDPGKYYHNNIVASCTLFEAMRAAGVNRIVFSSTAATYGIPETMPITEEQPQQPINPYGFSKFVLENALRDYSQAYGWAYAALRYFNAAGASPDGDLGEDHDPETHLIPIVLQVALGQRESVSVFGDDYPTPDGSCVRDYIHVNDLASAHLAALERLEPGQGIEANLGTGHGFSVWEVIEACRRVTGKEIKAVVGPRRDGDPPELVADASRARSLLDWEPKYQFVDEIVDSAWRWHQAHPHGYASKPAAQS